MLGPVGKPNEQHRGRRETMLTRSRPGESPSVSLPGAGWASGVPAR